eukprot:11075066-Lingulodinium_polyedra.AAC.1
MVPSELLSRTIRDCLPEGQREGWKELQSAPEGRELSTKAIAAATWVERNGAEIGFRTPTVQERSRITGAAAYLRMLQLDMQT